MICKLCLCTKPLVESHIIPEYFYQGAYEAGHHRYRVFDATPKHKVHFKQKGLKEPLLCDHCDRAILGELDDYARKLLFGTGAKLSTAHWKLLNAFQARRYMQNPVGSVKPPELRKRRDLKLRFALVEGVDFESFGRFAVSVLWRASVSNQEFFRAVKLTTGLQESLRQLLLGRQLIPVKLCEFFCRVILVDGNFDPSIIMDSGTARLEKSHCAILTFGSMQYYFNVGGDEYSKAIKSFSFHGNHLLMLADDFRNMESVVDLSERLYKQGKL